MFSFLFFFFSFSTHIIVGPGLALAQVIVVAVVAGVLGTREVPAAAEAHLAHFLPVTAPPLPLALPILPPLLYLINRESMSFLYATAYFNNIIHTNDIILALFTTV